MNTVGKALLILGVVLAIGGGLLFWKTKAQSASTWTNVSKAEMETILKDLNPMMIKQISSTPDGKEKITKELKQLLAFAAEARKSGMKTLEESGYNKINEGTTTNDEVLRLTMASGS